MTTLRAAVCRVWMRVLLTTLLAVGCALAASVRANATPLFLTHFQPIDVGSQPNGLAMGDLNGDGRPDVVTSNTAGTITVRLGVGDGTLGTRVDYAVGPTPFSVALKDLNGDGKLDAVVGDYDNVAVLLGAGDGSFGPATHFPAGLFCRSVALTDLNGDGRTDAVTANYSDNTLSIMLGNGDGTFTAANTLATGNGPTFVAASDVNGDGKSDIGIALRGANMVSVLLGNGDGSFTQAAAFSNSNQAIAVTFADFDADGKPDIAFANAAAFTVSVARGNGDGTFGSRVDYYAGSWPMSVIAADVNGDGKLDLLSSEQFEYTVSVQIGDGHGGFGPRLPTETAAEPTAVATADMNSDGIPDVVTANAAVSAVTILNGNGNGTFGVANGLDLTGGSPYRLAMSDLDRDGKLDLVTCNIGGTTLTVLRGRGDGHFDVFGDVAIGPQPRCVSVGDFNGDGIPDLATTRTNPNVVSILLGNGDGTFGAKTDYETLYPVITIAIADLNQDGKLDLAASTGAALDVLIGNGDGTFAAPVEYYSGEWFWSVAAGDLTGDGIPDLILTTLSGRKASLLRGIGDGTFGARTNFNLPGAGMGVSIADLNGDGRQDFVAFTEGTLVPVFIANSNGTFTNTNYGAGRNPENGVVADVDGDGHLDVVAANSDVGYLTVLLGTGTGAFGGRVDYGVGANPQGLVSGDFDGDSRLDLAVANAASHSLDVLVHPPAVPQVSQQPASQTLCATQNLSLSVGAIGVGLAYRWRRNGAPLADGGAISGSATAALTVTSVFSTDAGSYDVLLTNAAGALASAAAIVTVCDPPVFVASPTSTNLTIGSPATLNAPLAASCTTPTLRWQKDGVPLDDDGRIVGSASATLSIDPIQPGDAGYYGLVATNACGTQTSSQASLIVNPCATPPTITTEPADVVVPNGQPASFTVVASGCVAPTYQWLKGHVPLAGGTGATLTIANVTDADADYYQVAVTAGGVSTLSRVAVLNVPGPVLANASHRIIGTTCVPVVELFWQINVPCAVRVDYEYTNVSTYAGPLTHSATLPGPATSDVLDLTPDPGTTFVCYQITATDAASRSASTTRRMASVPGAAFTLNKIVPSLVTYPYRVTLVTTSDAVAVGLTVSNSNCTSLAARVTLDQAQLKLAFPRNAAGAVTVPMVVAGSIPAGGTVRMPTDLKFLRSQVGVGTGGNASFTGRLKLDTVPVQYKTFAGTVRMP